MQRATAIIEALARWGDRSPEHGGLAEFYVVEIVRALDQRSDSEAHYHALVALLEGDHAVADLAGFAARIGGFEPGFRPTPLFALGAAHVDAIVDDALREPALAADVEHALAVIGAGPAPALGHARLIHVLASRDHADKVAEFRTWATPLASSGERARSLPCRGARVAHWRRAAGALGPALAPQTIADLLDTGGGDTARDLAAELRTGAVEVHELPGDMVAARRPRLDRSEVKAVVDRGGDVPRILVAKRPDAGPRALIDLLASAVHEYVHVVQARAHGPDWPSLALVAAETAAFEAGIDFARRNGDDTEARHIARFSGYGWRQALRNFIEYSYLGWYGVNGPSPSPYDEQRGS